MSKLHADSLRQRLDDFVWSELYRSISAVISEAMSQIGPKPKESIAPNNPEQAQISQPTILLGRSILSFRLPKSITALNNLDEMDISKDKETGKYSIKTGLCFMERLEGWTIECLLCKRCLQFDTIYRHLRGKKQFRSISGALKYILYEEYPLIQDKIDICVGEQSTTIILADEIHTKLMKDFREIIHASVSPLSKRPDDFSPEANETSIVPYTGRNKRKKISHIVLGELHMSFVIPEDSEIQHFNIDQIERPNHIKQMYAASIIRPFCFNERLSGWIVERTKRQSGACDLFYYHLGLRKTFRSMNEVVNFLLYEICPTPRSSYKEHKMKTEKGLYVPKTTKAKNTTEEENEANAHVVNFFRKSLDSMKLMGSHQSTAETDAGNQSQWKEDEYEKENDTKEEITKCNEPLPPLERQDQPTDCGGGNEESLTAILEGMQGGEGSIERDDRIEITKDVGDSSKKTTLNEDDDSVPKKDEGSPESLVSLKDVYQLQSSCEMMKLYSEYESLLKDNDKP